MTSHRNYVQFHCKIKTHFTNTGLHHYSFVISYSVLMYSIDHNVSAAPVACWVIESFGSHAINGSTTCSRGMKTQTIHQTAAIPSLSTFGHRTVSKTVIQKRALSIICNLQTARISVGFYVFDKWLLIIRKLWSWTDWCHSIGIIESNSHKQ